MKGRKNHNLEIPSKNSKSKRCIKLALRSQSIPDGKENVPELVKWANEQQDLASGGLLCPMTFSTKATEGFETKKGTEPALNKLKDAAKRENVTIGVTLLTAVHWAFAHFNPHRFNFNLIIAQFDAQSSDQ